jgi:hypothetical protein
MKPRRIPLWLAGGIALLAAAALAWWLVRQGETSVSLPGGGKVVLLGTTYGMEHRFSEGSSWVKLIRRWISPERAVALGFRDYLHYSPGTNLVIWTYWQFPTTNAIVPFASVADANGFESEPLSPAEQALVPGKPEAMIAWQFKNFPRRQPKLLLRFYERDASYRPHRLVEMQMPNPMWRRYLSWNASAPPVSVKQGDFEFSLLELRSGEATPERLKLLRGFVAPWTTAAFSVRRNGQLDHGWRLRDLEVLDAAGNSFWLPVPPSQTQDGRIVTGFNDVLWPEDGAWRITAEFSEESGVPADQTWTFRNVPLRPGNPTVLSNLAVTIQGITLTNVEVSMLHPSQLQPGLASRNAELKLGFTPSIPGVRVDLIEAVDERGRRLEFNPSYEFPAGVYSTRLGAPADAQTVDLTFGIRPSRIVEFLVTPEFVTSNTPSAFPPRTGAATNSAQ